ncbi:uncharacterized protein BKA55DRAFT_567738 [Fusarium redolens]|jgi:hypothetical protein|uniref:Uncharacterized protein n=1 Tax=Fusarium redolens TaxID=48865 RepID=A0A9P9KA36_FUSRE|nr:uncharacterized protein BKA55DRAFT_567738 [Fusarium redolens]KAH7249720.1 hypothetical protein BKA55DRAFT_567738 [Fusarium redolens]
MHEREQAKPLKQTVAYNGRPCDVMASSHSTLFPILKLVISKPSNPSSEYFSHDRALWYPIVISFLLFYLCHL